MKNNWYLMILCFIFSFSFAHKDRINFKEKGNVKIFVKSSWDYAELYKANVAVDLIYDLSNFLNEKDTIFVNYGHRNYIDSERTVLAKYTSDKIYRGYLIINITDKNLEIVDLLKIVEFSIKNKKKIRDINKKNLFSFKTLSDISNSKTSAIIDSLLDKRIDIVEDVFFKIKWKKNVFYIFNNNHELPLFKIDENKFHSIQFVNDGIIIFPDYTGFYFVNNDGKILKKHDLKCEYSMFYFTKKENEYSVSSFSGSKYMYNKEQDVLIQD